MLLAIIALVLSPADAETYRWATGLILPLIVGLITKTTWSPGLKSTVNVVLAAFATFVYSVLDKLGTDLGHELRNFILVAVVSFASYYGLWKPTGVAARVAAITG